MQLPQTDCLPAIEEKGCGEEEFSCGDGQCIPGVLVCDDSYHCSNGADELSWWVFSYKISRFAVID